MALRLPSADDRGGGNERSEGGVKKEEERMESNGLGLDCVKHAIKRSDTLDP